MIGNTQRPHRTPKSPPSSSQPASNSGERTRQLKYESLEHRCLLSADGWDVFLGDAPETDPGSTAVVSTEQSGSENQTVFQVSQAESLIDSLQLKINGETVEVTDNWQLMEFNVGDEIEIVGITYTYDGAEPDGVFAAESYVSKLTDYSNASLVDYADGRFSDPVNDVASGAGQATLDGVEGSWTLQEGWDRLTVNLMHYTSSGATVAGRFVIQMEVGEPDFQLDHDFIHQINNEELTVGKPVKIPVSWINAGQGKFHDYAEVDVFYGDTNGPLEWAGALVGNADNGHQVSGGATNTRGDFSEYWTPKQEGTYTLLYTVDPENTWSESDESNNEYQLVVHVKSDNLKPVAKDDFTSTESDSEVQVDVLKNDIDLDGDELKVEAFNHGEHGKVSYNEKDGSLTYTPEEGFSGEDQFEYIVTDGEHESNVAVVTVDVQKRDTGIEIADAHGEEDKWISLDIQIDTERYQGVQIDGVPEGAKLKHAKATGDQQYQVDAKHLDKLKIRHTANSDVDFQLQVTPISHDGAVATQNQTLLNVTVDPVYDGGTFDVQSFGIEAGRSGNFPHTLNPIDRDGSEVQTITIKGLPDYVSMSAGYRDGDNWILEGTQMDGGLKVIAGYADDTSGWSGFGRNHVYQRLNVTMTVVGRELRGAEVGGSGSVDFFVYFFQRV